MRMMLVFNRLSRRAFFGITLLIQCFLVQCFWVRGNLFAQNSTNVGCVQAGQGFAGEQLWGKVIATHCLKCHRSGGDAKDSRLVFRATGLETVEDQQGIITSNLRTLALLAKVEENGKSILLQKPLGELNHGGEQIFESQNKAYQLLEAFVLNVAHAGEIRSSLFDEPSGSFFRDVEMLSPQRLLRKATLSLAGRLPQDQELLRVAEGDDQAMIGVLNEVMLEDAFFDRLREGFNDVFLTQGVDGNPDSTVLSYEHFEKTRLWYQQYDLSHIEDENERRQAGYRLANEYRAALLDEPMRLIEYIVRNDRPFTEIVTADYIMVSPYTARGYGVYEEVREQFRDPDDPFDFIPVKLQALKGRNAKEDQDSETGYYPHAGILSTFQYLSRYPTTETNRNRLRARMYFLHFLGIDVLELAARGSDAAAATEQYEVPTMQAAECVVCHQTLDPIAGLFQDYWRFDRNFAIYGKRHEGWFEDMFHAGYEGEQIPPEDRWRALQWLGERTVRDPRFAIAMTEHAYFLLTGRRPLSPPKDLDDPLFDSRYKAWRELRCETERIARQLVENDFNFKQAIAQWVVSDFYRADSMALASEDEYRLVELDDLGVVRMLSPEQLERKILAVFRRSWGKLTEQTAMLYGGIDSKEVTERASDPGGAMGAIQRTLSNDVACRNVAYDFSRPASERLLFPHIEAEVLPGVSVEWDQAIRMTISQLHWLILGREDSPDSEEVGRTFRLFSEIIQDAKAAHAIDPREAWSCRQGLLAEVPDPHYTVRSWRAVVTYLLRQEEFLYE